MLKRCREELQNHVMVPCEFVTTIDALSHASRRVIHCCYKNMNYNDNNSKRFQHLSGYYRPVVKSFQA